MSAQLVFLRPAAVEDHVRRTVRRLGADDDLTKKAIQRAALEMRLGGTAHRAIVAGVEVAESTLQIKRSGERRRDRQPSEPPSVARCIAILAGTFAVLVLLAFLTQGA